MILASEFAERRDKLFAMMGDDSFAVLYAGVGRKMTGDSFAYTVNRNFYYLTGIDQENSVLMLVKSCGEQKTYLFIDEYDERKEKWTGVRLTIEEARERSDISNILFTNSLQAKLDSALSEDGSLGHLALIYLDLESELKIKECYSTQELKRELEANYNNIRIADIYPFLVSLRMIKSPAEITLISEAIKTTDLGIKNVLLTLRPGLYEYNLRNTFEYAIKEDNDAAVGFDTIVAGGKNAVILHYPNAKDCLNNGELVLLDLGARRDYYSGDITRTFPINGHFLPKQRTLYEIVLGCNKAVINFARPGLTIGELQKFAIDYLAAECVLKGFIKSKEDVDMVYYHGVSHHLGLDVHDVSNRDRPLEPGMVITVEPGLYFKNLKIGIRIEDDVLITETGCENLSKNILKEVHDIEKIMLTK
ncbi:MAG: aminopeptidase P N-terminal domain-containing protein [Bacilli bacterium]|jgi:Xaa-Pro aminopeptidase